MNLIKTIEVSALTVSAFEVEQCDRHVELLILQDASSSFRGLVSEMPRLAEELVDTMTDKLGVVYSALSSFIDKPIPGRGIGNGRGHPEPLDYCYRKESASTLSSDFKQLAKGYENLFHHLGSGGDYPESMHEAILYGALDSSVGWSDPEIIYDESGKRLVRVLLMVTDDVSHIDGDAVDGAIAYWNKTDPVDIVGWQFWGDRFAESADFFEWNSDTEKYYKLRNLYIKGYPNLSDAEKALYDELYQHLGPDEYPNPEPHPHNFEASEHCTFYEYPVPAKVGEVLRERNIVPIIAISDYQRPRADTFRVCAKVNPEKFQHLNAQSVSSEEFKECIMAAWATWMKEYGVEHYILTWYTPEPAKLIETIVKTVDQLTRDVTCPVPTTTTTTTTTSTKNAVIIPPTVPASTATIKDTEAVTRGSSTTYNDQTVEATKSLSSPLSRSTASELVGRSTSKMVSEVASSTSSRMNSSKTKTYPYTVTNASTLLSTTKNTGGTNAQTTVPLSSNSVVDTTVQSSDSVDPESTMDSIPASEVVPVILPGAETDPVVDPVVIPNQGPNAGVIAGATGGAAAGAALIGGILYKQFGVKVFARNSGPEMQGLDHVDNPDSPMERECREEVTMDMFQ